MTTKKKQANVRAAKALLALSPIEKELFKALEKNTDSLMRIERVLELLVQSMLMRAKREQR